MDKTKSSPIISLKNITKTYITGEVECEALRGINLEVFEGEFVAIMGPSGSGKSTLMHIIGALDVPTSGSYLFRGKEIDKYDEDELSEIRNKEVGFVFQSFNLLPRTTVLKNVERPMMYAGVPSEERQKRALQCLRLVDLVDKANSLSNQLSGGQIQRVAVARALVMNPTIVLADEPTGNLDTVTAHEMMEFLKELNMQAHTIILITHEVHIAAYAKRIVRLQDGTILSDEPNKSRAVMA